MKPKSSHPQIPITKHSEEVGGEEKLMGERMCIYASQRTLNMEIETTENQLRLRPLVKEEKCLIAMICIFLFCLSLLFLVQGLPSDPAQTKWK
nr:hypothetical protein CFP56_22841 [Quercus suber]